MDTTLYLQSRKAEGTDSERTTNLNSSKTEQWEAKTKPNVKDQILQLIVNTTCSILIGMHWIAFPMFYVEFSEHFHQTKMIVGGIGSVQHGLFELLGFVFSAPIEVYGPRAVTITGGLILSASYIISSFAISLWWLYISYGVITAIGHGLANLALLTILQQQFDKNRSLATTTIMMGKSFGQLIGPLVIEYLIIYYSWRGAMLIYGGLLLNISVLSLLLHQPKHFQHPKKKGVKQIVKKVFDFHLFKQVAFTLFCVSIFLVKLNINGFYHHLPSRVVYYGASKLQAAWLLSITSISSLLFRLVMGIIGNFKCTNRSAIYTFYCLLAGAVSIMIAFVHNFPLTAFFTALFGGSRGSLMLMLNISLADLFGAEKFARSKGLQSVFAGIAALLSTPFTGLVFDYTQNYNIPFIINGIIGLVGGIFAVAVVINIGIQRYRNMSANEDQRT